MPVLTLLMPLAIAATRIEIRASVRLLDAGIATRQHWDPPRDPRQIERRIRDERGRPLVLRLTEYE